MLVADNDTVGLTEPLSEPETEDVALLHCETLRERVGELVMLSDGDADHVGSLAADTEAEPLAKAEPLRVKAAVVAIGDVDATLDTDALNVADAEKDADAEDDGDLLAPAERETLS